MRCSEPNLKAGSCSLWDLPCLCYQAYSFIYRPICVSLLLLRPALYALVVLEDKASVSVNTELVDVRAAGVADIDA